MVVVVYNIILAFVYVRIMEKICEKYVSYDILLKKGGYYETN